MDDYRDLVTVGFALVCAAVMLVAGELYIEHRAAHPPGQLDSPQQPPTSPALISHAPSPQENTIERRQGVGKNRAG